jgi:hypothetical protein
MKLTPVKFKQHTTVLNGKGERGDKLPQKIPVHLSREHGAYVSCWKLGRLRTMSGKQRRMAFKDRFMFLLGLRPIWMVVYAKGHPPVYLTCEKSVFTEEEMDD